MSRKPYLTPIQNALNFNIATVRDNKAAANHQIEGLQAIMELQGGRTPENCTQIIDAMHDNLVAIDKKIEEATKKATPKKGFFSGLLKLIGFGPSEEQKIADGKAVGDLQNQKKDMLKFYAQASSQLFAGISEQNLKAEQLVPSWYKMDEVLQAIQNVTEQIYADPDGEKLRTKRAPSPSQVPGREEQYEVPVPMKQTASSYYTIPVPMQQKYYEVPMEGKTGSNAVFDQGGVHQYEYDNDDKARSITGSDGYEQFGNESYRSSSRASSGYETPQLQDVPGYKTVTRSGNETRAVSPEEGYQSGRSSQASTGSNLPSSGFQAIGGIKPPENIYDDVSPPESEFYSVLGETGNPTYDVPKPVNALYAAVKPASQRNSQQNQDAPQIAPKLPPRANSAHTSEENVYSHLTPKEPSFAQRGNSRFALTQKSIAGLEGESSSDTIPNRKNTDWAEFAKKEQENKLLRNIQRFKEGDSKSGNNNAGHSM